jgi:hypothetical protein
MYPDNLCDNTDGCEEEADAKGLAIHKYFEGVAFA